MRACQLNRIETEVVTKGTIYPFRQPVRLRNRHALSRRCRWQISVLSVFSLRASDTSILLNFAFHRVGDSSTVETRTLTPSILVRIQVPQPNLTFSRFGRVPRPMAGCEGGGFR